MKDISDRDNAADFCECTRKGIEKKADHNKREAMRYLVVSLASTLMTPIFITLGPGVIFGKAVPAILSAVASFCTAWLQLRKPQQLWSLYRGAQREIEDEQTKFRFQIDQYADAPSRDRLLVLRVAAIALKLHEKWAPLVPSPETLRNTPRDQASANVITEGRP